LLGVANGLARSVLTRPYVARQKADWVELAYQTETGQ